MVNFYVYRNSLIHRTSPLIKICVLSAMIILSYVYHNLYWLVTSFGICILAYFLAQLSLVYLWKAIKFIIPVSIVIGIYNGIFISWYDAGETLLKLMISIGYANLLSLTTPLNIFSNKNTKIYTLLTKCKIPPSRIQLAIHIVLRTIPLLLSEITELKISIRLRGRSNAYYKLIFPLLLRTVSQSDKLVDSLTLRGYE